MEGHQYLIHYLYNGCKGISSYHARNEEEALKKFHEYRTGEILEVEQLPDK